MASRRSIHGVIGAAPIVPIYREGSIGYEGEDPATSADGRGELGSVSMNSLTDPMSATVFQRTRSMGSRSDSRVQATGLSSMIHGAPEASTDTNSHVSNQGIDVLRPFLPRRKPFRHVAFKSGPAIEVGASTRSH